VSKDDFGEIYLMPAIATLAAVMFLFYVLQLLINIEGGYKFAPWVKLIGPLGSALMCLWKS